MDCDNQEIEATKTIGSTDIDKVLKNLKNKHTKELYKAKAQVNINMKNQINEILDLKE